MVVGTDTGVGKTVVEGGSSRPTAWVDLPVHTLPSMGRSDPSVVGSAVEEVLPRVV